MKRALAHKTLGMFKEWALYYTAEEWVAKKDRVAEICAFVGDRVLKQDPKEFLEKEAVIYAEAKEAKKLRRR